MGGEDGAGEPRGACKRPIERGWACAGCVRRAAGKGVRPQRWQPRQHSVDAVHPLGDAGGSAPFWGSPSNLKGLATWNT
jgi:hypothetical protein